MISNCGTPTKKASDFLDYQHKSVMQSGRSYIKDIEVFLKKIKNLGSLPENVILLTADLVGLYPNIPHKAVRQTLEEH